MADTEIPVVQPEEAIAFFRRKGITFGFAWQDVWQDTHALAFTVAKAMSRDILEDIRAAVDQALSQGQTLAQFREQLTPILQAKGWWGRSKMVDPATGRTEAVQLGSPRRLKTIYQVNLRTAYQAGRWERVQRQKAAFPLLRYVSVMDGRERPQHHAWHGTLLPVDDDWWRTHYPPCGWNCRCTVQSFNQRMADRRGYSVTTDPVTFPSRPWRNKRTGEVHQVEQGIDPGWSYNVGEAALAGQAPPPMPGGFDGADLASAGAGAADVAAFFGAFDIEAADAREGRVVFDPGGFPLAISLAWLQQDGRLALPAPARRHLLGPAGAAMVSPAEIRWAWVQGDDGRAMLMRRYVALDRAGNVSMVVDVGAAGWRFLAAEEADVAQLRRGTLVWSAPTA